MKLSLDVSSVNPFESAIRLFLQMGKSSGNMESFPMGDSNCVEEAILMSIMPRNTLKPAGIFLQSPFIVATIVGYVHEGQSGVGQHPSMQRRRLKLFPVKKVLMVYFWGVSNLRMWCSLFVCES